MGLYFESITNKGLDLDLIDQNSFICGDSGTGKSYIIRTVIKHAIKRKTYTKKCNVDVSRFVVIDDDYNITNLSRVKDKSIVFIDRYDSFSDESKNFVWRKMKKVDAAWIIMTRYPDFPKQALKVLGVGMNYIIPLKMIK